MANKLLSGLEIGQLLDLGRNKVGEGLGASLDEIQIEGMKRGYSEETIKAAKARFEKLYWENKNKEEIKNKPEAAPVEKPKEAPKPSAPYDAAAEEAAMKKEIGAEDNTSVLKNKQQLDEEARKKKEEEEKRKKKQTSSLDEDWPPEDNPETDWFEA